MKWDAELEQLMGKARDHFGEAVVEDAIARALWHALDHRVPAADALKASVAGSVEAGDGLLVLQDGAFEEALREELRRLLRPN